MAGGHRYEAVAELERRADCSLVWIVAAADEEAVTGRNIRCAPAFDRCTRPARLRGVRRRQSERPLGASRRKLPAQVDRQQPLPC